jgi:hypothetical protein
MAVLRWIHMRKLVPLTELLGGVQSGPATTPRPVAVPSQPPQPFSRKAAPVVPPVERRAAPQEAVAPKPAAVSTGEARDAFLLEIRKTKQMFYNTVVAQAQKIEFGPDRVTFSFLPAHRMLREQVETSRSWLEQIASGVAGRRMTVGAAQAEGVPETLPAPAGSSVSQSKPPDLKTAAMADSAVQAMLDVFPAEIENVEEID